MKAEDVIGNGDGTVQELKPSKPKTKTLLPSCPPGPGAKPGELSSWLTVTLGLGADPIASAVRYGKHEDARMSVVLRSEQRIVFDRQADAFDAPTLRRRVIIATGATIPHYGPADVQAIATVLMRLAELASEDDDRHEALEWAHVFLAGAERNMIDVATIATPAGRYEALSILAGWRAPADLPPYAPAAERAVIVRVADTGVQLLRTSDFAAHVRGLVGRPISWPSLHSRMVEIGWQHRGEVEQRQPQGDGRVKTHVYAIPASWDAE
jgi:hypothetical protein